MLPRGTRQLVLRLDLIHLQLLQLLTLREGILPRLVLALVLDELLLRVATDQHRSLTRATARGTSISHDDMVLSPSRLLWTGGRGGLSVREPAAGDRRQSSLLPRGHRSGSAR